jgi:phosphatidylserine decarboxylase
LITKYGYDVVGVILVIVVAGSVLSYFFIDTNATQYVLLGLLLLLLLLTLAFFRDPDRKPPEGDHWILSPADGRVILIEDMQEAEYLQCAAVQVSIFMSPLDVHVNRYPFTGTVGYFKHHEGEFLVAFDKKASTRNERTHIGIEQGGNRVLFKQVAGFVARRIVANVKVGDRAVAGARFGMIKFGSRVDVILPRSAVIRVRLGERAVAGETILAALT